MRTMLPSAPELTVPPPTTIPPMILLIFDRDDAAELLLSRPEPNGLFRDFDDAGKWALLG